jgi:exoribonuclease II
LQKSGGKMAYSTLSHWTATEWNDELEAIARDKFVPLIKSVGASRVQMIRTGDLTFSVVTEYSDEATANAAKAKIAEIRQQAAQALPMTMSSASAGAVFASG